MVNLPAFETQTLSKYPTSKAIQRILSSAIEAVHPGEAVKKFIRRDGNHLLIDGKPYAIMNQRVVVIGLGKAAHAMTTPVIEMLSDISPRGVIIPKISEPHYKGNLDVQPGGHPIPNEDSILAGTKVIELVKNLSKDDLLICLISGGGSALMTAPYEGISISDLKQLNSLLLSCGAKIDEINTIRRQIDRLKGGGLTRTTAPARVVSLILSDVIGDALETIASGPTAIDPTSREDALGVLEKYNLINQVPSSILKVLEDELESGKHGEGVFEDATNLVIGNNKMAVDGALEQAVKEGFHARSIGSAWQGETRKAADELCRFFQHPGAARPFCLVGGGETTVSIKGGGLGGRNQELALAAVKELSGHNHSMLITLATDGEDGPTNAAGAVASDETYEKSMHLGMNPTDYLNNNDSYTFFNELGDLLKTGPSGTNVNDLYFLLGF